ncbi:LysR family transcriptional regulator [Rhodobacteraceae bacterium]|nr:LysR family transcriptional regulator [Paracoccaceae bacterium]
MNWQAITFDWNQVRAFLATLEEGSLSAAARALNLTQPTLGRQVAALETELGVTLFERAGRKVVPTPAALEIAEHVRDMGEAAARFSLAANGQSQSIEGEVKISASEIYSMVILPDLIEHLRAEHPGIVIDIVATNALSDLRSREADIAIRNAEPSDPDLIARKMGNQAGGLFASPAFVAKYGPFRSVDDLAGVPFIGVGDEGQFLTALNARGVPVTEASIVAKSTNHLVHWELTKRGLGIGANGSGMAAMSDEVVPILSDVLTFEFPVWLVAPRELKTNRRVRLVFDALARHLTKLQAADRKLHKSA